MGQARAEQGTQEPTGHLSPQTYLIAFILFQTQASVVNVNWTCPTPPSIHSKLFTWEIWKRVRNRGPSLYKQRLTREGLHRELRLGTVICDEMEVLLQIT